MLTDISLQTFAHDIQMVEKYFNYHTLEVLVITILIFLFFMLLRKIFAKHLINLLIKIFSKTRSEINKKIFTAFQKPTSAFFLVLGIYASVTYFRIQFLGKNYAASLFIQRVFSSSVIITVAWGLYNLTTGSSVLFSKMQNLFDISVDKILFPFISKGLRFLIVAFAFIIIVEKWGYNIQGFIAGLGLGGLAFALAAKDAAANMFGGIVIFVDKPFKLGDWICTSSIEGSVEEISFRSTRIRTAEQGVVTVPNSVLVNAPITNWNRRDKRKVNFSVGVTYDTSVEKIKLCVSQIRDMLKNNELVYKDSIIVNFDNFSPSSLDILLNFYITTSDYAEFLNVKEKINYDIMQILENNNVDMAFPSTSIYLENSNDYTEKQNKESTNKNMKIN